MSNVVCPKCSNDDFCLDLIHHQVICNNCGDKSIPFPKIRKCPVRSSIFQRITRSPEVLASQLVHIFVCEHDTSIKGWTSNIIFDVFDTYEEAIAATVARLKEMAE